VNLEQIRSFHAVAVHGGFSRAAERLGLTQSTVSMQVGSLERELGVRLFERLGRRIRLTPEGAAMLEHASRILAQVEAAKRTALAYRGLEAGELVVGASLTIGNYLLPELLGDFHRSHPGVRLVLDISPSYRVGQRVAAGELDIGLVEAEVADPELEARPFHTDELVLIVPPDHRWAARGWAEVGELAEEPFLEREPGSGTREIVRARLAESGVALSPALELGSPEALKRAVRAGLGVAIVSIATVELELRCGVLRAVPVRGLRLSRPFLTLLRRDKHLSPVLSAFLELVRSSFGSARS